MSKFLTVKELNDHYSRSCDRKKYTLENLHTRFTFLDESHPLRAALRAIANSPACHCYLDELKEKEIAKSALNLAKQIEKNGGELTCEIFQKYYDLIEDKWLEPRPIYRNFGNKKVRIA
jgi:hypothetical protein